MCTSGLIATDAEDRVKTRKQCRTPNPERQGVSLRVQLGNRWNSVIIMIIKKPVNIEILLTLSIMVFHLGKPLKYLMVIRGQKLHHACFLSNTYNSTLRYYFHKCVGQCQCQRID